MSRTAAEWLTTLRSPVTPVEEAQLILLCGDSGHPDLPMLVRRILFQRDELKAEVERLKTGRLTPAEIQNLCHNLQESNPACTRHEFERGCAEFQNQLSGEKK